MENIEENESTGGSKFDVKNFLWLCLSKWYIFLTCMVLCGIYGYYKLMKTPKVYAAEAGIMIKDKGASSTPDVASIFSDISSFDTYSNLNNEMVAMTSSVVTLEVAERLGLDVDYTIQEQLHVMPLYGTTLPFKVKFLDLDDNATARIQTRWNGDGTVEFGPFARGGEDLSAKSSEENIVVDLVNATNDTIVTPLGKLLVNVNPQFTGDGQRQSDILVSRIGVQAASNRIGNSLKTTVKDNYSTIVNLSYNDNNPERATDVLREVINVYNKNWIDDRNEMAVATYNFINDRLGVIEAELGSVDLDISGLLASQQANYGDASTNSNRSQAAQDEITQLNSRLSLATQVRNQLGEMSERYTILPGTSSLANAGIDSKVSEFNNLVSYRKSLVDGASEESPVVQQLDQRIADRRQEILSTLDSYITGLRAEINIAAAKQGQASARLIQSHTQAPHLHNLDRQQKVKESLYLYLLQKREENQLSQAFAAYNSKVVTPPYSYGPISPNARSIIMTWLIIGLLIPGVVLFLFEMFNSRVRGRKDIEKLTIPFVGEIPLYGKKKNIIKRLMKRHKDQSDDDLSQVVVKRGSGNVINEAFRVIRTNLEFMVPLDNSRDTRTLMLTSANPGSGKTFVTLNMASVLSLKGKSVAMVDLDLRKAALSQSCGTTHKGITNYLAGHCDLDSIVVRNPLGMENVALYPVGPIPPNPAELLYSEQLDKMIKELKEKYDYVLIDCPPVEVVADAKIINRLVDVTLFVIRAGLMERGLLKEVQKFYDNKRYYNMALILNGTPDPSKSKFNRANRFGYGYGYGYGYPRKK